MKRGEETEIQSKRYEDPSRCLSSSWAQSFSSCQGLRPSSASEPQEPVPAGLRTESQTALGGKGP